MDKPTTSEEKSRRSRSPLNDLIKCFCGACESWFKRKHVIQALKANAHEVLLEEDLRAILKKFVEFRNAGSHIPSPISQIIDCFELCDAIVKENESLEDRRYDLEDMCFTEAWEDRLSSLEDDREEIEAFLKDLMGECGRRMGEDSEYQRFKEELSKKLK